eukprot:CAMPEP_0184707256 /NCGR_PEP_ID=MMETSP0313-20130426/37177_1 /TAXON_ID=2792 /ORGANISM="Porphyridium aerugineum, Strain SAG 1380-2" /LENGTH=422 /DNA_ID=CAMNT_0027168831 /DNA_START=1196 /DNA_END=2464 /DNA_ORIENTATION=-
MRLPRSLLLISKRSSSLMRQPLNPNPTYSTTFVPPLLCNQLPSRWFATLRDAVPSHEYDHDNHQGAVILPSHEKIAPTYAGPNPKPHLNPKLKSKHTTVLLIGWMGCRMRYLQKYANLYRDLNSNPNKFLRYLDQPSLDQQEEENVSKESDAETARVKRTYHTELVIPSTKGLMMPFTGVRQREANSVMHRLLSLSQRFADPDHSFNYDSNHEHEDEHEHEHEHEVVFHIFSNNGFYFFCQLLESIWKYHQQKYPHDFVSNSQKGGTYSLAQHDQILQSIPYTKIIIDSAPADLDSAALIAAFRALGKVPDNNPLINTMISTLATPLINLYITANNGHATSRHFMSQFDSLVHPHVPILLLHSVHDKVIASDQVHRWVIRQKNILNRNISTDLGFDCDHVDLLRSETKRYVRNWYPFVSKPR